MAGHAASHKVLLKVRQTRHSKQRAGVQQCAQSMTGGPPVRVDCCATQPGARHPDCVHHRAMVWHHNAFHHASLVASGRSRFIRYVFSSKNDLGCTAISCARSQWQRSRPALWRDSACTALQDMFSPQESCRSRSDTVACSSFPRACHAARCAMDAHQRRGLYRCCAWRSAFALEARTPTTRTQQALLPGWRIHQSAPQ